ncbi:MAG: transcription-repair coupling factor [Anaerolineaceae bacterium]|nr:transcription-repair coupling factor [Anaerolineaceae bacterium]
MLSTLRLLAEYQNLLKDIQDGVRIPGLGLARSARLPILAGLQADLERPILYITDRSDRTSTQLDELGFWKRDGNIRLFPEPTPLFYEQAAWGAAARRERLLVLTTLASYHITGSTPSHPAPLFVAPVRAVMTRTLPRRDFLKNSRILRVGQQTAPQSLVQFWVGIGYEAADVVLMAGQFSRRGGLLDIWPPAEALPVRFEFFGDEIETLRSFDPATQRTVQALERVTVTPAREFLPEKARSLELAGERTDEFYLPVIHPMAAGLLEYLPSNALVVIDNLDAVQTQAIEIEEQAVKARRESITEGTLPADFPTPYLSWSELQDSLSFHQWIELGRTTAIENPELGEIFQPGPRFGGRLKLVMEHIQSCCQSNEPVHIVSRQAPRLAELWKEQKTEEIEDCSLQFVEGSLSEGWVLETQPGKYLHLLTDSEIFGWDRPRPRSRNHLSAEAPEAGYADINIGDWVVHIDYGIGRFRGLVNRMLEGAEREFLQVEYENGDHLYVPVHQADRLSRYIGPDSDPPSPTRLGTGEWTNAKQRVREGVQTVAHELLELYAQRQAARGYAFSPDSAWQQELEASFSYIETQDQLRAIQDVKQDMQSHRPMDRLLCGDVGYGKTEVALRAAFKAVMDGKQVAILVPTTVLAQQHFETFQQRLAAYPVEVEMLSRFRTHKEQEKILQGLAQGKIDMVIGTHRLVQADVAIPKLGLVIIDEEQRFGVAHKEFLKRLRTEVDVLTLTATPIPRTLYMALTGVRDISTINTPPEERLPIVTHVGPYSPRLVRQAILRELERGGQIFFVHNRVQTIPAMEKHLHLLVPEAKVGVAHGQMHETELAAVMQRFTRGDIDVLLCTSIIESGLDIPNANTLLVDRADTFGLAQLYQLRGRVGRGAQRAYAYFFRHRHKAPTLEGQERLEVIADNTQLGAGYSIAMRDLEMRGAGELLGMRQHGYINSVGFQLYTRMLSQAVREIRMGTGLPVPSISHLEVSEILMPVGVDLPLMVGIPIGYVPDQKLRIQLYRRLADTHQTTELDLLGEEFKDRFGLVPEQVQNLFYQMRVRLLAEQAGLSSVNREGDQIVLRYPSLPAGIHSRNLPFIDSDVRAGKNAYWMVLNNGDKPWQERLLNAIQSIIESVPGQMDQKVN